VLWWVIALALPFILMFLVFEPEALWQQVVEFRLSSRAAFAQDNSHWAEILERLKLFIQTNPILLLLAGLGLVETLIGRMRDGWLLLVWLALAGLMLLVHEPLRYKHFSILLPLLGIWAGVALAQTWAGGVRFRQAPAWIKGKTAIGLLLAAAYMLRMPATLETWRTAVEADGPPADEIVALDFIQQVTTPADCLITDDMPLAYWSGRMVPPELAEVSTNRLQAGELTLDELVAISTHYDCQVVAAVSNRIPKYLPEYTDWVKQNYWGRFHYGEDHLYVAKANTVPDPVHPMQIDFEAPLRFLGYTLDPPAGLPGVRLPLVLYWKSLATFETDYTIFVHLRDTQNVTWLAADHRPYLGVVPTTHWRPGGVIKDVVWLDLPADLPPGEYHLWVGLYRLDTMERLPVAGDLSGEHAIDLGVVRIE
jgi:hypothetical protein